MSGPLHITDAKFEEMIQTLPNPVVTSNGAAKFLTVGTVTYTTPLVTRAVTP